MVQYLPTVASSHRDVVLGRPAMTRRRLRGALLLLQCVAVRQQASQQQVAANAALEAAEDEATNELQKVEVQPDGALAELEHGWAASLQELTLGEDGVDDERLPTISVGGDAAELPEASANAVAILRRKQLTGGLRVEVLENQVVVVSGMETKGQRQRREAAGLGPQNQMASDLACHPINGTAIFFLVHRHPTTAAQHQHEIAFFTPELWADYVEYMTRARESASFFGGSEAWHLRIHWNTMPSEQRQPWALQKSRLSVVATPKIAVQYQHG